MRDLIDLKVACAAIFATSVVKHVIIQLHDFAIHDEKRNEQFLC